MDRIDADRVPANEHRPAVAVCDHGGAVRVVSGEPNHHRERRPGVAARGSKGSAASPCQPNVYTLGNLPHGT